MKKLILCIAFAILVLFNLNAQNDKEVLSKGSFNIEVNTGTFTVGNTSFSLSSSDGFTSWSIGAEGGYFIIDNLAIKGGLGYADTNNDLGSSNFSYKIGLKYYIARNFPVGVDFTGSIIEDLTVPPIGNIDVDDPLFIGVQGGYAWFVAPNISLEPTIRYNISLLDDDSPFDSAFQGLIGFVIHF